jgi:hypothetical protein
MFARLKIPNCLLELVPAFRTLESNRVCIDVGHLLPFQPSLSCFGHRGSCCGYLACTSLRRGGATPIPAVNAGRLQKVLWYLGI